MIATSEDAPHFRITTKDGHVYVGPVMGFGGLVQVDGVHRITIAIDNATLGMVTAPTSIFEPKPGHARVVIGADHVDVPLAGAVVQGVN